MPTSSQIQVLVNLTGNSALGKTEFDGITKLNLTEDDNKSINNNEKAESSPEEIQPPDIKDKLHNLGFWSIQKKEEKIGVPSKENDRVNEISESEYSKTIVDEVMSEVKKKPAPKSPPEPMPCAICFDAKNVDVEHIDILHAFKRLTSLYRNTRIETVQYLPLERRWRIIMDSQESRDRLSSSSIYLNGQTVQLRRYDDVVNLEYKKYLRTNGLISITKQGN